MVEYDSASLHFAESKLANLGHQIDAALAEEFPNPNIRSAALRVRANISSASARIASAGQFSNSIKEQILLGCALELEHNSYLLGLILRANATRNPFELYYPFRELSQSFFPNDEVYLILSSEWNYTPLTYPTTLEELPNYIVIAMPAAEADNVLAFPTAGHELGHSVWFRRGLKERLSRKAYDLIVARLKETPNFLPSMFPHYKAGDFETDMIALKLRDSVIDNVLESCLRQLEELFCDLIAVNIFGPSYLHAFRYLLAPTSPGERSKDYPEIAQRAGIVSEYAETLGFPDMDLEIWFAREEDLEDPIEGPCCKLADKVRTDLFGTLVELVEEVTIAANLQHPSADKIAFAKSRFSAEVPVSNGVSLGELICAAWELYLEQLQKEPTSIDRVGRALSDLVLKSAEALEYKVRFRLAS